MAKASSAIERERIDADFFAHTETERLESIEANPKAVRLRDICETKTSGFTPKLPNLREGEASFVTIDCISPLRLHTERFKRIPQREYDAGFSGTRKIPRGAVLCTIKRRICQAYPFIEAPEKSIAFNQDVALLVPSSSSGFSAVYLAAYLGSSIGQSLANREQTEQMNPYLSLIGLGNLPIIPVGAAVEEGITHLFNVGSQILAEAKEQLAEAENLLLDALDLRDWSPPVPLSYTGSVSSVLEAERFDANYFAPKYDAVFAKLNATGAATALGDGLTSAISRGTQPDYGEAGLPVVNSKHVRTNRVLVSDDNRRAIPGKWYIKQGDVLINGTGVGTIGRAAPYLDEQHAVPDNHVTIVRPTGINPLYLSVYLNSQVGQLQIERMISGSSGQIELYPVDIRQIIVWDAPKKTQLRIADAVQRSCAMENRASELLAAAKRAVEIAIEDSEAAALDFIAEQDATNA